MIVQVSNGELEFRDGRVLIRKKGLRSFLVQGPSGERSIPVASITAIQMKPGGLFLNGFIQFSYAGGKQFTGTMMDAASDPDAVIFGNGCNDEIRQFKALVESAMETQITASTSVPTTSLPDELRKLAQLRDEGILTDAEFAEAKQRLLADT
jgi:hypothetical protein